MKATLSASILFFTKSYHLTNKPHQVNAYSVHTTAKRFCKDDVHNNLYVNDICSVNKSQPFGAPAVGPTAGNGEVRSTSPGSGSTDYDALKQELMVEIRSELQKIKDEIVLGNFSNITLL